MGRYERCNHVTLMNAFDFFFPIRTHRIVWSQTIPKQDKVSPLWLLSLPIVLYFPLHVAAHAPISSSNEKQPDCQLRLLSSQLT
jgi:hypothetical protein